MKEPQNIVTLSSCKDKTNGTQIKELIRQIGENDFNHGKS